MTTTTDAGTQAATLQMVRAEVDVHQFHRWMGTRRLQDPDHAMHCLLKECFGDLAPKPFRLIVPRGGPTGCLYGYGQADADALREASGICADPLQSRILRADTLDSKPMPTEWQAGKRLGFEVRIRPIVRLLKDPSIRTVKHPNERLFKARRSKEGEQEGAPRRGKECDVFLWEAIQHSNKGEMKRSREEVYSEWLSAQLDRNGGASLDMDKTKLVSFQRSRAFRKLRARHTEGPDAVMWGVLKIADPDKFGSLLARGVGRHRAYGYGMLLLHPARI